MPVFWFALILQLVFGVFLGWLPIAGTETVGESSLGDHLAHLVLPTIVLSFNYIAGWSRYLRSLAGHRSNVRTGDVRPRLPAAHGHIDVRLTDGHCFQPCCRPSLRVPGPENTI